MTKKVNFRHWISAGVVACCFLALAMILWKGLTFNPSELPSALIDRPAMAIDSSVIQVTEEFPLAKGETVSLNNFSSKLLVVNFWASWCVSCREEARELQRFWVNNREKGIAVLGIAVQDTPDNALTFAREFGKTYLLALDDSGKASINYGVTGVPETFVIDGKGVIRFKKAGPVTAEQLQQVVERMM